ncbi:hypothetical protein ACDA63_08480 [Uliginosibacterium sp. sgz301328]|uniref:hypothetical protein n=1 Tax=Uliginosibacterium sp. sgz301328 TaxID=3243764 RepID=UPI00359CCEF5
MVQATGDKPFDWNAWVVSGFTGWLSSSGGLLSTAYINMGGALVSSGISGQDPTGAMNAAAAGTIIGYPAGAVATRVLNPMLNPWYRPEWQDIGFGISKYAPPSAVPAWVGGGLGGAIQESTVDKVQRKAP